MPETLISPETSKETLSEHERQLLPTPEQAEPLRKNEVDPRLQAALAREKIARTAAEQSATNPLERLKTTETVKQPTQPLNINQELKAITLNRELRNIQRKLPAPQRTFSKLIHQPVVRTLSTIADKTVSRPSGLLGGGIVAFLGTSGYFYLTKSAGFSYNYFVFVALFVGGFIVGLVLELLVHLATSSHHHSSD